MKRFWISWEHKDEFGGYTLNAPRWRTGYRLGDGLRAEAETICAAVVADDEESAVGMIYAAYDDEPEEIAIRFVEEKPNDWSPFNDRFPLADWMKPYWPDFDEAKKEGPEGEPQSP